MKFSIVLAGAFAALSLVAPAWAETGGGDESAATCDVIPVPVALFTTPVDKLSTVEREMSAEDGQYAGLSDAEIYKALYKSCFVDAFRAVRTEVQNGKTVPQDEVQRAYLDNILQLAGYHHVEPSSAIYRLIYNVIGVGLNGWDQSHGAMPAMATRFSDALRVGGATGVADLAQRYKDAGSLSDLASAGAAEVDAPWKACLGSGGEAQASQLRDYAVQQIVHANGSGYATAEVIKSVFAKYGVEYLSNNEVLDDETGSPVSVYYEITAKGSRGKFGKISADLSMPKLYQIGVACSEQLSARIDELTAAGASQDAIDQQIAGWFHDLVKDFEDQTGEADYVKRDMYKYLMRTVASHVSGAKLSTQLDALIYFFDRGDTLLPKAPSPT